MLVQIVSIFLALSNGATCGPSFSIRWILAFSNSDATTSPRGLSTTFPFRTWASLIKPCIIFLHSPVFASFPCNPASTTTPEISILFASTTPFHPLSVCTVLVCPSPLPVPPSRFPPKWPFLECELARFFGSLCASIPLQPPVPCFNPCTEYLFQRRRIQWCHLWPLLAIASIPHFPVSHCQMHVSPASKAASSDPNASPLMLTWLHACTVGVHFPCAIQRCHSWPLLAIASIPANQWHLLGHVCWTPKIALFQPQFLLYYCSHASMLVQFVSTFLALSNGATFSHSLPLFANLVFQFDPFWPCAVNNIFNSPM